MPGPCSMPEGSRRKWAELNEIVCDVHYNCDMAEYDKNGKPVRHDYMSYRIWLMRRNRLRTGKTI